MIKYLRNLLILGILGTMLFFIQKNLHWSQIKLGGKIFLGMFDTITVAAIVETIILMIKKICKLIFTEKFGINVLKIPILSQMIYFFGLLTFLIRKIKI